MRKKMHEICGRDFFINWIEVLLPVIILTFAILHIPMDVLAEGSRSAAAELASEIGARTVANEPDVLISGDAAGIAEGSAAGGGESAEEKEKATDLLYRIKPLQDMLSQMDSNAVDGYADRFADMGKHWSRQQVGKLTGLGIIAGVNGKFLPAAPVQADQFIKMTIRAMGYEIEQGGTYWAQPYIDAAIGEGIVLEGEFDDYSKPLSREQMARIIVRTALKADKKPDSKYDRYIIGRIKDYHDIDDSLKQYVIDAYNLGLVTGSENNRFNPGSTLARAEAAAVIIRFLDREERKPMRPGEDEIIRLDDSRGNPVEIYPGSIPELFTVAKAAQEAIPKAKGYVCYFIGSDGKFVCAKLYKDKTAFEQSIYNMIAAFDIAYNDKESTYAYTLTVWDDEAYKEYFPDYIREIMKTVFEEDAQKAIALHDQYMNMRYTRTDGLNEFMRISFNNRNTLFIRYDDISFGFQIKLKGMK